MTGITTYLSILTLNVNRINSPIKRHHLANWIKKEDPKICCESERLEEDLLSQWPPKIGKGSNSYLGQSRHQTYINQMR
jgi:exonuclease III